MLAFLQNHRVGTTPLMPGMGYVVMAREAAQLVHGSAASFELQSLAFESILFLDEAELRGPPTLRLAFDALPAHMKM